MAPKKAPAAKQPPAEPAAKRQTMEKGDISRMLSYLKYHSKESNKSKDDQQDAATALAKYTSTKTTDKNKFLEQYEANKGNLKWIHSFDIVSVETKTTRALSIDIYTYMCSPSSSYMNSTY